MHVTKSKLLQLVCHTLLHQLRRATRQHFQCMGNENDPMRRGSMSATHTVVVLQPGENRHCSRGLMCVSADAKRRTPRQAYRAAVSLDGASANVQRPQLSWKFIWKLRFLPELCRSRRMSTARINIRTGPALGTHGLDAR